MSFVNYCKIAEFIHLSNVNLSFYNVSFEFLNLKKKQLKINTELNILEPQGTINNKSILFSKNFWTRNKTIYE